MIDTHTHLGDEAFKDDLNEVVLRAQTNGINYVVLPNVDESTIAEIHQVQALYPEYCALAMGLHPTEVKENYLEVLDKMKLALDTKVYCAVGEIGLDFYWDTKYKDEQIDALKRQLEWALAYDLPVLLHIRKAYQEAIQLIEPYASRGLRGIFHCFGGGIQEAKKVVEMGFYLGIGGVVTFKNSHLGDFLPQIGLEHLVLETDAPYLAPVPHRGHRNEPAYVRLVCEKLATIFQCSCQEIDQITTKNAQKLFNFSDDTIKLRTKNEH